MLLKTETLGVFDVDERIGLFNENAECILDGRQIVCLLRIEQPVAAELKYLQKTECALNQLKALDNAARKQLREIPIDDPDWMMDIIQSSLLCSNKTWEDIFPGVTHQKVEAFFFNKLTLHEISVFIDKLNMTFNIRIDYIIDGCNRFSHGIYTACAVTFDEQSLDVLFTAGN